MLGDKAAVGILANGGDDKKELLVNTGFRLGNSQQVILSARRLKQSLDFSFPSGTERVTMAQDSACGRISGVQGRLGFAPLEGSLIKVSLGYEQLRYELQAGKESTHRPTTGLEWQQQLAQGLRLLVGAERFASQDRYTAGLQCSLADAGGSHSIGFNLIGVQGRSGQGDERQVQVAYSYTFVKGAATHGMPMPAMPGNRIDNRSQLPVPQIAMS